MKSEQKPSSADQQKPKFDREQGKYSQIISYICSKRFFLVIVLEASIIRYFTTQENYIYLIIAYTETLNKKQDLARFILIYREGLSSNLLKYITYFFQIPWKPPF